MGSNKSFPEKKLDCTARGGVTGASLQMRRKWEERHLYLTTSQQVICSIMGRLLLWGREAHLLARLPQTTASYKHVGVMLRLRKTMTRQRLQQSLYGASRGEINILSTIILLWGLWCKHRRDDKSDLLLDEEFHFRSRSCEKCIGVGRQYRWLQQIKTPLSCSGTTVPWFHYRIKNAIQKLYTTIV